MCCGTFPRVSCSYNFCRSLKPQESFLQAKKATHASLIHVFFVYNYVDAGQLVVVQFGFYACSLLMYMLVLGFYHIYKGYIIF